ncbi:MAG: FAD:protein FMN transferase, partial [Alphaproteobacteria bacterium]|nr:FAD:protein FMN transferase [Alphaproteobacteria bacterium]
SGLRANRYTSVTVTAPTATLADALSSSFCVMAEAAIAKYLKKNPAITARLTYAGGRVVRL